MKTVLITGGNKGLGKVIVETLQSNYNIGIIGRSAEEIETNNLLQIKGDITNLDNICYFLDKINWKWSNIDILINNAGLVNLKSLLDYTEQDYNNIFEVNVKGAFLMTQEVIKRMFKGYIINVGSTRSITGAANKSLYSMSKFALRSLTQCINSEYKEKGIYSTIVCPGNFDVVPKEIISRTIKHLIELPIEAHIPEIIIGGML